MNRREIYERDILVDFAGDAVARFDREAGLAHPGRSGERKQPHLLKPQHVPDLLQVALAAEQPGWLCPKAGPHTHSIFLFASRGGASPRSRTEHEHMGSVYAVKEAPIRQGCASG